MLYAPPADDEAQGVQVALVCGPERGRHAVLVLRVAVALAGLVQQVQVAIPRRSAGQRHGEVTERSWRAHRDVTESSRRAHGEVTDTARTLKYHGQKRARARTMTRTLIEGEKKSVYTARTAGRGEVTTVGDRWQGRTATDVATFEVK